MQGGAPRGEARRWSAGATLAAPALVLLAGVLPVLRYHDYSLLLPESLILLAAAATIGVALGAMSLLRPLTLGPVLMALTLGGFAILRPEIPAVLKPAAAWLAQVTGGLGFAVALIMTVMLAATWAMCHLVRRHVSAIVAAAFGTMVLSTLLLPVDREGEPVASGALPARLADLPPVIHVVLDEHIGLAALPADLPESAAAVSLIQNTYDDFALFPRAYSRFAETQYSLGALMNGRPEADVTDLLEQRPAGYTLRANKWFDRLKMRGYALRVYQSTWLDMCQSPAVDTCYTYPLYSMNAVQRSTLSTHDRLHVILSKLGLSDPLPMMSALASAEAKVRFLADLAQAPRGVAYIVHLLSPHDGYLFRDDCVLERPPNWTEAGHLGELSAEQRLATYREYIPQLICAQHWVSDLIDELKTLNVYDEATIIVHGDHGSRIGERPYLLTAAASLSDRDLLDHFSTFLAVKAPGTAAGSQEQPVMVQETFTRLFLGAAESADSGSVVLMRDKEEDAFASFPLVWPDRQSSPVADATVPSSGKRLSAQAASVGEIGLRGGLLPATR